MSALIDQYWSRQHQNLSMTNDVWPCRWQIPSDPREITGWRIRMRAFPLTYTCKAVMLLVCHCAPVQSFTFKLHAVALRQRCSLVFARFIVIFQWFPLPILIVNETKQLNSSLSLSKIDISKGVRGNSSFLFNSNVLFNSSKVCCIYATILKMFACMLELLCSGNF